MRRYVRRRPRRYRTGYRRRTYKRATFTDQRGLATGIQYRARKLRPRAYKRSLFNQTRHETHYRSQTCRSYTSALAGCATCVVNTLFPLVNSSPNYNEATPFWTYDGGLKAVDKGSNPSGFKGDIVLRGGKIWVQVSMLSPDINVGVDIYVFRTLPNADYEAFGLMQKDWAHYGWDPTCNANISTTFGKMINRKSCILNANQRIVYMEQRLGVQKMDKDVVTNRGSQLCYVVCCSNLTNSTAQEVRITYGFSVSFTGDVL